MDDIVRASETSKGAVNEVVIQWLSRDEPDLLTEGVPALTPLLLGPSGPNFSRRPKTSPGL